MRRRGQAPVLTPEEQYTVKITGADERMNTGGALGYAVVTISGVTYNCGNSTTLAVPKGTAISCRTSYVYNAGQACFPYIYYDGAVVSGGMDTNGSYDFEVETDLEIDITLSETSNSQQYYGIIEIEPV